jgi:hypothetical protein
VAEEEAGGESAETCSCWRCWLSCIWMMTPILARLLSAPPCLSQAASQ